MPKKILMRADDLGYCEAINYAIARTIDSGLIKNIGLMINMKASEQGFNLVKGRVDCIGLHTNISVGIPVCEPSAIPTLVDSHGNLHSSSYYKNLSNHPKISFDDLLTEIEAQLVAFQRLTGRQPDYFDGHAILFPPFFDALEIVADKYGLKYSGFSSDGTTPIRIGHGVAVVAPMRSMQSDYDAFAALEEAISLCKEDLPTIFVAHPGYLDEFVLSTSSLTINRTKDCAMLCAPETWEWFEKQDVQSISYKEIN